ncbi:beta-1,4-N-acetylglucosamine oligosaccharide 6-O-sulfotransferase NodH [Palleronia aestuarii]|uniref:Beta-1,4-N-acetylglucosamine oligosaccharide 6-O-sulfotransferase NodH n=1 Tax=Palleronia aestuarii TaxID=568105 RepID=A0A2W7N9F6_9RHOB|nr:sulfotransferase [Palleronia aestuarii]PZX13494.1 beta-1,4-N-acetylglucosamine oligosaccharide 6-O-sulfotransferase NodH [Palleronia aestuarii]
MSSALSMPDPGRRFVIMGLPRSGTTYLMTLLNAHHAVFCSGEQFNPRAIVGIGKKNDDRSTVFDRDSDPVAFMDRFFETQATDRAARTGFKFMIGHNVRVLDAIAARPDLTLIYVHRINKLAQVSSLIKARKARRWAQSRADRHIEDKIVAGPLQISQLWHEFETYDRLFSPWFEALPHRRMAVEYCEMFVPDFNARLCDFLGIAPDPKMKSPLLKQSANRPLERFEKPEPIRRYFTRIGRADWLDAEL